jgi:hypothetical protein
MTTARRFGLGRTVEVVAAVGVILSLLFVGLEIRQNTAAVRAQTRQGLTTMSGDFLMQMATTDLGDLWFRWAAGEEIDPSEWNRLHLAIITGVRNLENIYLQYREGVIDESALSSYGWRGSVMYGTDRFAEWWWAGGRNRFNPMFVAAFEAEYPKLADDQALPPQ